MIILHVYINLIVLVIVSFKVTVSRYAWTDEPFIGTKNGIFFKDLLATG